MSSSSENNETHQLSEFQMNLTVLRRIHFFSGFSLEALKVIAYLCTRGSYAPEEPIFSQDEPSRQAVCLLSGEADLLHATPRETYLIRRAASGDFFGAQAILGQTRPLFTLKATAPTECLVLHSFHFWRTIHQFPDATDKILGTFLESVRAWEERFLVDIETFSPGIREKMGVSLL